MNTIKTGPSASRVVRAGVLVALTAGFAVAFLYDGYAGYAKENLRRFLDSAHGSSVEKPEIIWPLTASRAKEIVNQWRPGMEYREIESAVGRPGLVVNPNAYFFGPGGRLEIDREGPLAARVAWADGIHSETDQLLQRWIGYGLGAAAIGFGFRLIRVLRSRVVWGEAGLFVSGEGWVAPGELVEVRTDGMDTKGRVEIVLVREGKRKTVRLDVFDYKNLRAVVREIAETSKSGVGIT